MKKPMLAITIIALGITSFSLGAIADDAADVITATLRRDATTVVDGTVLLDSAGNQVHPIVYNGVTYLPSDMIASSLRATSVWDDAAGMLTITTLVDSPEQSSMTYQLAKTLENQAVYWAPTGNKLHAHSDCKSFQNGIAYVGTLEQGKSVRLDGWCGICAKSITDENYKSLTAGDISEIEECYTYSDYLAGLPVLTVEQP